MARAIFVKKARKANKAAGIKKGDSYYWWKFRFGGKHFSKTPPRPSQLTQSGYLSAAYAIEEQIADANPETLEDLKSLIEDWKSQIEELADECQSSFDNMPEGLQQGDTGQLLESRVEACGEWSSQFDNIDAESDDADLEALIEEVQNISPDIG